jgi:hypothetical protein
MSEQVIEGDPPPNFFVRVVVGTFRQNLTKLAGVYLEIYDDEGNFLGQGYSDFDGAFSLDIGYATDPMNKIWKAKGSKQAYATSYCTLRNVREEELGNSRMMRGEMVLADAPLLSDQEAPPIHG